jgi:hypothetical protein
MALEAQTLAKLDHPNIVRLYSFEQDRHTAFLVLDFIIGVTLRRLLAERGRALSLEESTHILQQVVAALHYAHTNGIVHRDVKPGNIMVRSDGHVFMSDFGIARALENVTMATIAIGTPAYMSPEQVTGQEISPRSDIYSLGVVLYEMVTGRRPFTGGEAGLTGTNTLERVRQAHLHLEPVDPRNWNPQLPPEAAMVILKALAKSPAMRWPDVLSMLEAWEDAVGIVTSPRRAAAAPRPPAELLEMKRGLQQLVQQGQWSQALALASTILEKWPQEREVTVTQFKVRYLNNLEQELQTALDQARQLRRAEDWEACLSIAKALAEEAPGVARYRELIQLCQQELQWIEASRQAERFIAQERWEDAEATLLAIPTSHPEALRLRQELDQQRRRKERVNELYLEAQRQLANQAWDAAIVAANMALTAGGDPAIFQPLITRALEEKRLTEQISHLLAQAAQAQQQGNWDQAIHALQQAVALQPNNPQLVSQLATLEEQLAWRKRLEQARGLLHQYQWQPAMALLEGIPREFSDTAELLNQAERCRTWQEKLEEAQHSSDPESILKLLDELPADFPGKEELRQKALETIAGQDAFGSWEVAVRQALDAGQWDEVISICQEALNAPQAPDKFRSWLQQAEHERTVDRQVEDILSSARQALDEQNFPQAIALLENASSLRPNRQDIQELLRSARQSQQLLERKEMARQAIAEQRWESAYETLAGIPEPDPEATQLMTTLQDSWKMSLLRELDQAESGQRWQDAITIFQELDKHQWMTPDLLQRKEHVLRSLRRVSLQQHIYQAIQQGDWKQALRHAQEARRQFPDDAEFQHLEEKARQHLAAARPAVLRTPYIIAGAVILLGIVISLFFVLGRGSTIGTAGPVGATSVAAVLPPATPTFSPTPTQTAGVVIYTSTPLPSPSHTFTPTRTPTPRPSPTRTPTRTPTPRPASTRTPTPRPTPTPASAVSLPNISLTAPANGAVFLGRDAAITLQWQSVKPSLQPDEYYLVILAFPHNSATWYDYQWTKNTSIVLPKYLFDNVTGDRIFRWTVGLIRLQAGEPTGDPTGRITILSNANDIWQFQWAGGGDAGGGGGGPPPTWTPRP